MYDFFCRICMQRWMLHLLGEFIVLRQELSGECELSILRMCVYTMIHLVTVSGLKFSQSPHSLLLLFEHNRHKYRWLIAQCCNTKNEIWHHLLLDVKIMTNQVVNSNHQSQSFTYIYHLQRKGDDNNDATETPGLILLWSISSDCTLIRLWMV